MKSGEDKLALMSFPNAVGNNLPCGNIDNRCQIPNTATVNKASEIAALDLMRLADFIQVFEEIGV